MGREDRGVAVTSAVSLPEPPPFPDDDPDAGDTSRDLPRPGSEVAREMAYAPPAPAKLPAIPGVTFLPSWAKATDPSDPPPFRTCDEDGTHHFSHIKALALSGKQYIHRVNTPFEATAAMRLGTCIHQIVLGARPGKDVIVYSGKTRQGKAWEAFEEEHEGADTIVTANEWSKAEEIADAIMRDPLSRPYLDGSRKEVPLAWEESGLKFSTSGIDILPEGMLGDLKSTGTVEPDKLKKHIGRMSWAEQVVFYRRGARLHGIDTSKGLFLLCAETKAPFEVVPFELTERRIDMAERTVSLWIEKLRVYTTCGMWPGYTQAPIPLDIEPWQEDDDDDTEEDA